MHIHNWFGIPRWVLDSQTQVRQALEVYSGKPVYFSAFKAKTLHREQDVVQEETLGVIFEHDIIRRTIKFVGTVEGLSGLPHTIEGEFRLRQENDECVWWVDIDSWEFVLHNHANAPGNFKVELLRAEKRIPAAEPRPRVKVFKKPEHTHGNNRIVEGSNILDRVVLEDCTHLLDTYTNW